MTLITDEVVAAARSTLVIRAVTEDKQIWRYWIDAVDEANRAVHRFAPKGVDTSPPSNEKEPGGATIRE
jgi:hypothetical protein